MSWRVSSPVVYFICIAFLIVTFPHHIPLLLTLMYTQYSSLFLHFVLAFPVRNTHILVVSLIVLSFQHNELLFFNIFDA
jgi:hypothetical protein